MSSMGWCLEWHAGRGVNVDGSGVYIGVGLRGLCTVCSFAGSLSRLCPFWLDSWHVEDTYDAKDYTMMCSKDDV